MERGESIERTESIMRSDPIFQSFLESYGDLVVKVLLSLTWPTTRLENTIESRGMSYVTFYG